MLPCRHQEMEECAKFGSGGAGENLAHDVLAEDVNGAVWFEGAWANGL